MRAAVLFLPILLACVGLALGQDMGPVVGPSPDPNGVSQAEHRWRSTAPDPPFLREAPVICGVPASVVVLVSRLQLATHPSGSVHGTSEWAYWEYDANGELLRVRWVGRECGYDAATGALFARTLRYDALRVDGTVRGARGAWAIYAYDLWFCAYDVAAQQIEENTWIAHERTCTYALRVGRFVQRDPDSWVSAYEYADNSPMRLSDPTGLRAYDPALDKENIDSILARAGTYGADWARSSAANYFQAVEWAADGERIGWYEGAEHGTFLPWSALSGFTQYNAAAEQGNTTGYDAAIYTCYVLEYAGTAASFMTGAGALQVAVKEGGKRVLLVMAKQAVVQTVKTAAAVEGGGFVAEQAGVSKEAVAQAKAGVYAIVQVRGLRNALRVSRMFANSLSKPSVTDPYLTKMVNYLWRPNAAVASGSTADAIRFEKLTGQLLSKSGHGQKGRDAISSLKDWLMKNHTASASDRQAAQDIIDDLFDALNK